MYQLEEYTLPLVVPGLDRANRPTFDELNYQEIARFIDNYYARLCDFIETPGVMRYSELVKLRRQALGPEFGLRTQRCRWQLTLACQLFRLGRRQEANLVLTSLENRLSTWEDPERTRCYLLWSALLRAATRQYKIAFELALQIAACGTNPLHDRNMLNFFRSLKPSTGTLTAITPLEASL